MSGSSVHSYNTENVFGESAGGACGKCSSGGARKQTAYNKFVKKEFAVIKKEYPTKTAPEILKLVAKKWRAMNEAKVTKKVAKKTGGADKKTKVAKKTKTDKKTKTVKKTKVVKKV